MGCAMVNVPRCSWRRRLLLHHWTRLIRLSELALGFLSLSASVRRPSLRAVLQSFQPVQASRAAGSSDLRSAYDFRSVTREGNVAVAARVALLVGGTGPPCHGGDKRARVTGRVASELRSICALTLIHTNAWYRKIRLHLLLTNSCG